MGVFSNLFGGGAGYNNAGPSAVSSAQVTNEGFDLQKPFIQDIFETAQAETYDIDDDGTKTLRGYEEFLGPRLADFSTEQTEALSGLATLGRQGLAGTDLAASPQYFQNARDSVAQGQGQFTSADAQRLMNPFLDEVIGVQQREAQRNFDSSIQPKLDAEAVAAGSFGGSRAGLLQAEAQRNLQQQLSDISARGRLTAFEQAQKAFEQEQGRQFQGAQLSTALGTEAPAQAARELGLLSSSGEVQQAQEQKALDLAEAEFIRQRDFPMRQLQEYQSLVRGFPFNPSTFEVGSKYSAQPTFGQQLLGGLGAGAGLFGAFGGFSPGKKAGGQVVSRQSGGTVQGGLAGLERHQNNILNQRPEKYNNSNEGQTTLSALIQRQLQNDASRARMTPKYPTGRSASDLGTVINIGEPATGQPQLIERQEPIEQSALDKIINFGGLLNAPSLKDISNFVSEVPTNMRERFDPRNTHVNSRGDTASRNKSKELDIITDVTSTDRTISSGEGFPLSSSDNADGGVSADFGNAESRAYLAPSEIKAASNVDTPNVATPKIDARKPQTPLSPLTNAYDEVDKSFADYMKFLEKKDKSRDERMSEAEENRERNLYLNMAEGFAKLGTDTEPGGILGKITRNIPFKELKKTQDDFRKEVRAVKDIEEEVMKGKLTMNMAKAKLGVEKEKIAIQRLTANAAANLANARASAERQGNIVEFNDGIAAIKTAVEGSIQLDPRQRFKIVKDYINLTSTGVSPSVALRMTLTQNQPRRETGKPDAGRVLDEVDTQTEANLAK